MIHAVALVVSLLISVSSLACLVSGAAILDLPLPGGLPFGNLLAAAALCGTAAAAVLLAAPGSLLRRLAVAAMVCALAWLPSSLALAGNLALNFSGQLGVAWLFGSMLLQLLVLVLLFLASASALLSKRTRAGAA
jgi:hypothetical protein